MFGEISWLMANATLMRQKNCNLKYIRCVAICGCAVNFLSPPLLLPSHLSSLVHAHTKTKYPTLANTTKETWFSRLFLQIKKKWIHLYPYIQKEIVVLKCSSCSHSSAKKDVSEVVFQPPLGWEFFCGSFGFFFVRFHGVIEMHKWKTHHQSP